MHQVAKSSVKVDCAIAMILVTAERGQATHYGNTAIMCDAKCPSLQLELSVFATAATALQQSE